MSNEIYEILGFGPGDIAEAEGWETEVKLAVDEMVRGLRKEAAEGKQVTPYSLTIAHALNYRMDPHNNIIGLLTLVGELTYRAAFPRQDLTVDPEQY